MSVSSRLRPERTLPLAVSLFLVLGAGGCGGTGGPARDSLIGTPVEVRVSPVPASAEIVFHSNGFVYSMDSSGQSVAQITFDSPRNWEHVAVSRDLKFIAGNEQLSNPTGDPGGHSVVWLIDLEKGTETQVLPGFVSVGNGGASWDAEGYIYFAAKDHDPVPNPRPPADLVADALANDIYRIRFDGTGLHRLFHSSDGAEADVRVSEDGTLVSFIKVVLNPVAGDHTEVWVMDRDGANPRQVYVGGRLGELSVHDPEVSPDDTQVAFSKANPNFKNFPDNPAANTAHDIWVVNLDGTGLRRLTKPGPISIIPHWRDHQILYAELNEAAHYIGTSMVSADGTDQSPTRLLAGASAPRWIPKPRP